MNKLKLKVINYLVRKFGATKDIQQLLQEVNTLEKLNEELKKKLGDPKEVVNQITDEQFRWYDYAELEPESLKAYHDSAQAVLRSEAFKNTVNHLNSEFAIWAAKQSKDFRGVRDMRHQISGINLLVETLEAVPDVNNKLAEAQEPYAGL